MASVNVNAATREELVDVAGLRPEVADEILKARREGWITSVEALGRVPGVGPATLERLRGTLDLGAPARSGGRGPEEPASRTAEAARSGAETAASVTLGGLEVARRAIGIVGEAQREVARRSTEDAAELGRALVDLAHAQTRHNLETLTALTGGGVDWEQVVRLQGEFLRASVERSARLARRYLEVTQAVIAAAAAPARQGEAGRGAT